MQALSGSATRDHLFHPPESLSHKNHKLSHEDYKLSHV